MVKVIMVCELSVKIKGENNECDAKTLTNKYVIYEDIMACETDPIIQEKIAQTISDFDGEPQDITVNIKIEIQ